jgi:hypothetical protein
MRRHTSCVEHSFRYKDDPREYRAVPYGAEDDDWGAASGKDCHDCYCPSGGFHHAGCDVEQCPRCGSQAISCDCDMLDDEF